MRRLKAAVAAATAALAVTVMSAAPAPAATTLGWRWGDTSLNVYDGTNDPTWKVYEAVNEWSNRTGITLSLTNDPTLAQITVTVVPAAANRADALGVAYYPPRNADVAYGLCRIELSAWVPKDYPQTAEHTAIHELGHCLGLDHNDDSKRSVMTTRVQLGTGFSKPQAVDLRNLRSIYQ